MLDPRGRPFTYCNPLKMLHIPERPRHLTQNKGFHQLSMLRPPPKESIIQVFLDLCELSQALQFLKDICGPLMLTTLGDCRDMVQHNLSSLPHHGESVTSIVDYEIQETDMDVSLGTYHTCRLAALLYTVHVTFPVPHLIHLRETLLPELQDSIGKISRLPHELRIAEIILWCAVVGGILAEESRPWFSAEIRRLCNLLRIKSWSQMLHLLQSFAWLDDACDAAGKALWLQIASEEANPQGTVTPSAGN